MASSAMVGWRDHTYSSLDMVARHRQLGEPMPKAPRTIIDAVSAFKTASVWALSTLYRV